MVKKDPGSARQISLATAGSNFTKPGVHHLVFLCIPLPPNSISISRDDFAYHQKAGWPLCSVLRCTKSLLRVTGDFIIIARSHATLDRAFMNTRQVGRTCADILNTVSKPCPSPLARDVLLPISNNIGGTAAAGDSDLFNLDPRHLFPLG